MMDIASAKWLLVDHAKFPGVGFLEVSNIESFTGLITDRPPTGEQLSLSSSSTLEVLIP